MLDNEHDTESAVETAESQKDRLTINSGVPLILRDTAYHTCGMIYDIILLVVITLRAAAYVSAMALRAAARGVAAGWNWLQQYRKERRDDEKVTEGGGIPEASRAG